MNYKEIWVSFMTIVRKEVYRFLRIWTQTLLPSMTTTILYFLIFGTFVGSQVANIEGYTYMQFIVPGLIMMAIINNSYSNVVSAFFSAKFMKSLEELMVSPTPNWSIILGYSFGGVLRGVLVGLLVTITSLLFVPFKIHSISLVFAFSILTALLFSFAGLVNAVYAKKFDHITIVPTFLLTPLTYLGGVFYSINALPEFWQTISKFNPILYMINGFRYGFLGISDVSVIHSLLAIAFFTILLFILCLQLLNKGIGMKE
jgi:ABC-2 type transport system permease protein